MRRTKSGHHVATKINGIKVQAFVPDKLPPDPALKIDGSLPQFQEQALLALGGLNTVLTLLPDKALFLYSYVRKEAVLSSQIEGTQSSLSDLLLFESDQAPGVPIDDVTEVSNYVHAMEHGLGRIQEGEVITNILIQSRRAGENHTLDSEKKGDYQEKNYAKSYLIQYLTPSLKKLPRNGTARSTGFFYHYANVKLGCVHSGSRKYIDTGANLFLSCLRLDFALISVV